MHHQVDIKHSYVLPADFFSVFAWFLEKCVIISQNNTSLVFINKAECVYCAVGTDSLNMFQIHHSL
jgi:hypothetical protein